MEANKEGLQKLTDSMASVNDCSHAIEEALGSLRDQVAEKIRVQRLLTRLDTLLKLPATLQEQIEAGQYRTATTNYLSAASILSKHSEGFESLKNIETECSVILENLKKDLEHRLLHWSGRITGLENYSDDGGNSYKSGGSNHSSGLSDVPDPPKSMTEVFECAGTLFILLQQNDQLRTDGSASALPIDADSSTTILSKEDLCSMSVAAAMRLLDRLLDTHLIEVQERRFSSVPMGGAGGQSDNGIMPLNGQQGDNKGNTLVPGEFLGLVLECASLYVTCFGNQTASSVVEVNGEVVDHSAGGKSVDVSSYYLVEFVQEAFSSFLSHVRSILLEESVQASRDDSVDEEGAEATHKEISDALVLLVDDVRALAVGLAAPEIGISPDHAARFLDQAMELTESMVRRRVDQKFDDLRLSVVKECLIPFAKRAVDERTRAIDEGKNAIPLIVQIASSTLSDCLQLVDDAIRSIFADSSGSSDDLPDLKDAVHSSTYRFAAWLANAFEIIAGGDSMVGKHIAEAPVATDGEDGDGDDDTVNDGFDGFDVDVNNSGVNEELGDSSVKEVMELLDCVHDELLKGSPDSADGDLHSDFILAIADLCRISEDSVPDNLEQSFAAHLGDTKKKPSRSIFPADSSSSFKKAARGEDEAEIGKLFQLAASRVLALYATNRGLHATRVLCQSLPDTASQPDSDLPDQPSTCVLDALAIAKSTALDCATIFGGSKRGGPVPNWHDDGVVGFSSPMPGRKKGLQMDIERLFREKVVIYPHPLDLLEPSRNAVMFLFFRILFRALFENARFYRFSSGGYLQLQVDILFLKHMVPHFVSSDYTENGANAGKTLLNLLTDVGGVLDDRCTDENCSQDEGLKRDAIDIVRSFVTAIHDDPSVGDAFVIPEEHS